MTERSPRVRRSLTAQTVDQLRRENGELRARLAEADETIHALRAGEVDAVLVAADAGRVYTLETADKPYRLLVEQMPTGAATLNCDGATIIYCNRRFADLLRLPVASLVGRPLSEFVAPGSRSALETLLREGEVGDARGEVVFDAPDGTPVPTYLGVSSVVEGVLGRCLLVADLSEKRNYEELQRAQQALKDADRKKDEFLATLAHELRNPLAPMRNAVEILKARGSPAPEMQWARAVLDRQVRVMSRLLEDLLDVSRISRTMLELRVERVDLAAVVEAAVETSRPLIDAGHHQLTVTLPAAPIVLRADPVRLAQVFANLLNNAAKFTQAGGRIWLSVERQGSEAIVSVRDNGIGISDDMLPHLFDIFAQARPNRARALDGLGIGLSLVKGLVELHGGRVAASSAGAGQGSEFIVRLPVDAGAPLYELTTAAVEQGAPVTRRRILVVDDNRDGADTLTTLLRMRGHDASTAYDGDQGLAAAERLRPEAVLLDIGMSKLDGFEVCRRIREQPWGQGICLIALTGWGQEADRRETRQAGFDHHLIKPVDPAVLMQLLESLAPARPRPTR